MNELSNVSTLEQLEALAASIVAGEVDAKNKLGRMIAAYAKIISVKAPSKFKPKALVWADEDGSWDNSYPPDQELKEMCGPETIRIIKWTYGSRATSDGFYHDLKFYTDDPGLYVGKDGTLYEASVSGTGRYGQFAAHPGVCGVQCEIEYSEIGAEDVSLESLQGAESKLREMLEELT